MAFRYLLRTLFDHNELSSGERGLVAPLILTVMGTFNSILPFVLIPDIIQKSQIASGIFVSRLKNVLIAACGMMRCLNVSCHE